MISSNNSNSYEGNRSLDSRVRNELKQLFGCFFLKGKISLNLTNAPSQIEAILYLPKTSELFSAITEVTLLFKLGEGYPEDPPALFLTSDLFPHQKSYTDILNTQNWDPSLTLTQIIKQFVEKVYENGLKNTLNTIFHSNHKTQSTHRHIQKQNNIHLQTNLVFNQFTSAFTSFKPFEENASHAKLPQTPIKYKKKSNSIKFYDISENKNSQNSKEQEKKKKKQAKPMNKNANLPKFLIRIFIKYVDRFRELYIKKQYDKLQIQCRKMKDWKRHDKKQHAFGLKHLKKFFQDNEDGYPSPLLNRKIIIDIIERYLLQEICENSQIPDTHRVGYLVACKVYSLRCRNSVLAGRIQSK